MKKILAILTTVVLVMSLCCFAVSADRIVGGNDGVESFSPTSQAGTVVLELTGQSNRYAIDIEFDQLEFTYGGENVWNVNSYSYEFSTTSTNPVVKTTVTITNHSDKRVEVKVSPVVSDFLKNSSRFTLTDVTVGNTYVVNPTISDHIYTSVLKAVTETNSSTGGYEAVVDNVEVTFEPLTNSDWETVLGDMEANIVDGKVTLGTITVTVSQN